MSSVLEKIDLPVQRRVISDRAFTPLTNKFRRAQMREESKVVNQMRLVVIPTLHRHSPPIWRAVSRTVSSACRKTPGTTKKLGRHADLACEYLNETPLTEASISRDIANSQASVGATENIERESDGVMTLHGRNRCHECFLQQVKPLCRRFACAQSFTKFCGRSSPKHIQVNMRICQFAGRHSKKRKRAAWSETHPNDGNEFPRINHERSATSPGNNLHENQLRIYDPAKPERSKRFSGAVDPQINRTARGYPLLGMCRCITQQPKTLDASVERGHWCSGSAKHRGDNLFEV
jgi:hypothetical protein